MKPSSLEDARAFLSAKRIAVVGVSRDQGDFSRFVLRELAKRGYEVVAVHPGMSDVEGVPCFAHVHDVWPPPEAALLMTSPHVTEQVVRDCAKAGVRQVWMHRGSGGSGAASESALAFCQARGILAIRDLCPFMALPGAGFTHRLHAYFRRTLARHHASQGRS